MKVTGTSSTTPSAAGRAGPTSAPGFSPVSGPAPAQAPSATSAAGSVAGVSALMALQGVEDATERRRRAIRRGSGLLDRLDALKLALLSDQPVGAVLDSLSRATREEAGQVEHPGLKAVLDQIELRAAVELAKAGRPAH